MINTILKSFEIKDRLLNRMNVILIITLHCQDFDQRFEFELKKDSPLEFMDQ